MTCLSTHITKLCNTTAHGSRMTPFGNIGEKVEMNDIYNFEKKILLQLHHANRLISKAEYRRSALNVSEPLTACA